MGFAAGDDGVADTRTRTGIYSHLSHKRRRARKCAVAWLAWLTYILGGF
jgi:hypothetical protein